MPTSFFHASDNGKEFRNNYEKIFGKKSKKVKSKKQQNGGQAKDAHKAIKRRAGATIQVG